MELVHYICVEHTFLQINIIMDLIIGIILCFFSCKCNEKYIACMVGIHGGFWTSFIFGILFWVDNSVIIGVFGSFLFLAACFINKNTRRFIIGFIATSKILFWGLMSTAQEAGHFDVNDKLIYASVIAGIVVGVFCALAKSEEFLFVGHVVIGTGHLVGVMSNWLTLPKTDILNSKSELIEFISYYYKMSFWDDGQSFYFWVVFFVAMEFQIIMRVRKLKREQKEQSERSLKDQEGRA